MTSTTPAPGGEATVTEVGLLTITLLAAFGPKRTPIVPVRLVPVIVTLVPPSGGPEAGRIAVTSGVGETAITAATPVLAADPTNIVVAATADSAIDRNRG